jgi:hypothetical protein
MWSRKSSRLYRDHLRIVCERQGSWKCEKISFFPASHQRALKSAARDVDDKRRGCFGEMLDPIE